MYERSYGSKYDRDLDVADIAKLIRAEIKDLVKRAALPADWKYSVRCRRFAGGASIDVTATSPVPVYLCSPGYYAAGPTDRLVDLPIAGEWRACKIRANDQWHVSNDDARIAGVKYVHDVLQALRWQYNHDGSEIQVDYFDVNFYGSVDIESVGGWEARYERQVPYLPEAVAS